MRGLNNGARITRRATLVYQRNKGLELRLVPKHSHSTNRRFEYLTLAKDPLRSNERNYFTIISSTGFDRGLHHPTKNISIHSKSNSIVNKPRYKSGVSLSSFDGPSLTPLQNDSNYEIQKTHEILHTIPIGEMTQRDLSTARSMIHFWIDLNQEGDKGAVDTAEQILERIFAEGRDGRNKLAFLDPSIYNILMDAWAKHDSSDGAERAEALLKRMEERYQFQISERNSASGDSNNRGGSSNDQGMGLDNNVCPKPEISQYNCLLHAWSLSTKADALSKAEDIITKLENTNLYPNADTKTYNSFINVYANQMNHYGLAQKAEDVLLHMTEMSMNGMENVKPETTSFNTVLKAWRNSGGGIEGAKRAEDILRLMVKLSRDGHENVQPDHVSYCTVINAYRKHLGKEKKVAEEAIERVDRLIDLMLQDCETNHNLRESGYLVFNSIINSYIKSDIHDYSTKVLQVYDRLLQAKQEGKISRGADIRTYSNIINGLSKNKSNLSPCEKILHDMMDGTIDIPPNTYSFNPVLNAYCKAKDMKKAEELFATMHRIAEEKGYDCYPDHITYIMMIDLYYKSDRKDSFKKALSMVRKMDEDYYAGRVKKLDSFAYSAVIHKLCSDKKKKVGLDVHDLLVRMEEHQRNKRWDPNVPDTIVYNMVAAAVAREGSIDAAEKIIKMIERMEMMSKDGNTSVIPDTLTYSAAIHAWSKSGSNDTSKKVLGLLDKIESLEAEGNSLVKLDLPVFETVLYALSDAKTGDGEMALNVFQRMMKLYKDGNELLKPSVICCNLTLKALCSDGNQPKNKLQNLLLAHKFLLSLVDKFRQGEIDFLPDLFGFHDVMNSWSNSYNDQAIEMVHEILGVMQELSNTGITTLKPDRFTYSIMVKTYSNSRRKNAANEAQLFFDGIDPKLLDRYCYNILMNAWAKSNDGDKVEKAKRLLDTIVEKNEATVVSYNTFLNVCSSSKSGSKKAHLELAQKTYAELVKVLEPDQYTYAALIKTCLNLCENIEERDHLLKYYFDICYQKGLVGDHTIGLITGALSIEKRKELFGNHFETKTKIYNRNNEKARRR